MSSNNIKRQAVEALATAIAAGIPALSLTDGPMTKNVFTRVSDDDKYETYPSMYVLPGRGTFTPFPDGNEVWSDNQGNVMWEVGSFEGVCEIRAAHVTPSQREVLEQLILDQFFCQEALNFAPGLDRDDMSSGIIIASIPNLVCRGIVTDHTAHVSLLLDSEEWREEFAWGKRRYSFMECTMTWSAYRLVKAIPTIEELPLDLGAVDPNDPIDGSVVPDNTEEVFVQEDGSATVTEDQTGGLAGGLASPVGGSGT